MEVNSKTEGGGTPLYFAAQNGHSGTVKLLLEHDCVVVNSKTNHGSIPLHVAAKNGHSGTVKFLLEDERVDVNSKTKDGDTPLHLAAFNDNHVIVGLLLRSSSLNTANHVADDGTAPVMTALLCESTDAFRELVNHRSVDLSITNETGKSLDTVARSVFHSI